MSQEPSRQYGTIKSPWADYAVYSFPDASLVGPGEQRPLMDAMNSIIAVNWQAAEPHWTAASSPFDKKFSLILVYASSGLVAFSVYRRLRIAGQLAVYRSGTARGRQALHRYDRCCKQSRHRATHVSKISGLDRDRSRADRRLDTDESRHRSEGLRAHWILMIPGFCNNICGTPPCSGTCITWTGRVGKLAS